MVLFLKNDGFTVLASSSVTQWAHIPFTLKPMPLGPKEILCNIPQLPSKKVKKYILGRDSQAWGMPWGGKCLLLSPMDIILQLGSPILLSSSLMEFQAILNTSWQKILWATSSKIPLTMTEWYWKRPWIYHHLVKSLKVQPKDGGWEDVLYPHCKTNKKAFYYSQ